jgi:hypothetical protein
MVLNFQHQNELPCSPVRSCLKKMGPLDDNLMSNATIGKTVGIKTRRANTEKTMSNPRLTIRLKGI